MKRGDILDAVSRLVVESCCNCGTPFAIEEGLRKQLLNHPRVRHFYCPNGHEQWYVGETAETKLRRSRDRLGAQLIAEQDQHAATERSRRALKGQITKLRRRIGKGVCPYCTRTFPNIAAHMETQHPEESA